MLYTLQVVLHGESGCGKSGLISVCSDVMSSMGHNIHLKHINCNAMRPGELLGYFCDTDQYVKLYVYSLLYPCVCVHTYMHTCYIHTYVHTYNCYLFIEILVNGRRGCCHSYSHNSPCTHCMLEDIVQQWSGLYWMAA